ncbi:MAG TPA: hypothetical protein VGJ86_25765 [Acidimicrobiales bacterium]|jgi:hypothetical protein
MSTRVTTAWRENGLVAIKAASTPEQIADLAVEAGRLRQARHPGVVELVDHRVGDERAELHLSFAGEPLDGWRGTVPQAAGLVAAIAATVADLHDVDVVHGRIDQSHVLISNDGRPRLCGFAPLPSGASPVDDVAALGRLLEELGERGAAMDRGRPSAFRWPRVHVAEHRALSQLVRQATDPTPARRPTARSLARLILAAFPQAELGSSRPDQTPPAAPGRGGRSFTVPMKNRIDRLRRAASESGDDELGQRIGRLFGDQTLISPDDVFVDRAWVPAPDVEPADQDLARHLPPLPRMPRRTPGPRRPVWVVGTLGCIGLAVVAVGGLALNASGPGDGGASESAVAPSPATDRLCAPAGGRTADVDGDGCPDVVEIVDGVVVAAGQRWVVGDPGDALAVGDWDCDGIATPALYRPSTGDVFVFPDWAAAGAPLAVVAVAQVSGGRALATAPRTTTDATCDALAVELSSGAQHLVPVGP